MRSQAKAAVDALHLQPADQTTSDRAHDIAEQFLGLFERAIADPASGMPDDLRAMSSGPALQRVEEQIRNFQQGKLAARGNNERNLRVLGIANQAVFVTNCSPSDRVTIVHVDTGKVAGNVDPGFAVLLFEIRNSIEGWRVYDFRGFSESECL